MNRKQSPVRSAAALIIAALAGCGSGIDLHPVNGKVLYGDDTPFPGGTIAAELISGQPRRAVNGEIKSDGSFELGTLEPGDGAVEGTYRAAVMSVALSEAEQARTRPVLDRRYESLSTSGLEFEVKPGNNELTIRVARPGEPHPQ